MTKGVAGAAVVAVLVLGAAMTTPAFARSGYGDGGYSSGADTYGYSGDRSGWSRGQRYGWNGQRDSWSGRERHGWSGGSYPPGWSHGQKRGWGDRGMPPGLYRRGYSNSYGY
jgi:hypothetical protein